jgi:acetate CoA/acetoacetate CoA-transferase alpha subunit
VIEVDGKSFLLELPITADFALINAKDADYTGNLAYALTARNFNPLMAMAATLRDCAGRKHRARGRDPA